MRYASVIEVKVVTRYFEPVQLTTAAKRMTLQLPYLLRLRIYRLHCL